jgi:hypothetical protein
VKPMRAIREMEMKATPEEERVNRVLEEVWVFDSRIEKMPTRHIPTEMIKRMEYPTVGMC